MCVHVHVHCISCTLATYQSSLPPFSCFLSLFLPTLHFSPSVSSLNQLLSSIVSLKSLCTKDKDIGETGIVFVDSVSRLIGLLLDYRNVHADASCKGQRMGCMFNLLVSNKMEYLYVCVNVV